jgi:hypothetical protein
MTRVENARRRPIFAAVKSNRAQRQASFIALRESQSMSGTVRTASPS